MDEMIFYPSRVHDDDIPSEIIIVDHSYKHLNLPCEPDCTIDREAAITWFHETWANRLQADGKPVIVVSRIYEEGEGMKE